MRGAMMKRYGTNSHQSHDSVVMPSVPATMLRKATTTQMPKVKACARNTRRDAASRPYHQRNSMWVFGLSEKKAGQSASRSSAHRSDGSAWMIFTPPR
eukprot:764183-Prymnesium_polylepis.1